MRIGPIIEIDDQKNNGQISMYIVRTRDNLRRFKTVIF